MKGPTVAEDNTIATWGYSKSGDEVFNLKPGENLPDGYFAHPAMIRGTPAEKKMRADAEKEGAPFQFEPKAIEKPAK